MRYLSIALCAIFFSQTLTAQQTKDRDTTDVETLDEIVIKAIRVDAESPITHSNVDKKELEKRNLGQDLPILLNFLPSVVTTSDAGAGIGYTGIRVRGVSAQSTNITINGIPYNDAESLGTFWVDLPDFSSSVESLQLQRGVGTSTNGSGAFGASINILTDQPQTRAFGSLSNAVGSYNTRKHTIKFGTGMLNDSFELSGRLSQIVSDGYIDRASADLKSYFLQGTYISDNVQVKALVFGGHEVTYQAWNGIDAETLETDRRFNPSGIYTDDNGQIRFYDNEVDNYKQDHYQLHYSQRFNNRWNVNLGLNYTYGRGYFEQYREDDAFADYGLDDLDIGGVTISETDLIRRRWLDNDFYVVTASTTYQNEGLKMAFGGAVSHYNGDHFGEIIWAEFAGNTEIRDRYYDGNGRKNDYNLYAKGTYRLNDRMDVFGDLQLRLVDYKTSGLTSDRIPLRVDEAYTFFNPKAGLTYSLSERSDLYASYARANREPSRTDFENNPDIKPESLDDFELGWRYNTSGIRLNANLYYMYYSEQLVLSGQIDDVGNPIRTNNGASYRLGLELDAAVRISSKLQLQSNITFSSNKNRETIVSRNGELVNLGATNLAFSPDLVAGNQLTFAPNERLQIALLSKYVGKQYMGNTDSEVSALEAYFVNDLNINYEFNDLLFFRRARLTALVNNLFNEKYVSNGYYYTFDDTWSNPGTVQTIEGAGYYPQATTNFLLGLTLEL